VTSRGVNRAVMAQLVTLYKETHLGNRLPAYDGRKSLYTAGPLPFQNREFRITLTDEDDGTGGPRFIFECPLNHFFFSFLLFIVFHILICVTCQNMFSCVYYDILFVVAGERESLK
jgi:hypothetical protein